MVETDRPHSLNNSTVKPKKVEPRMFDFSQVFSSFPSRTPGFLCWIHRSSSFLSQFSISSTVGSVGRSCSDLSSNEADIATGMPRRQWSDEGKKGRCDVWSNNFVMCKRRQTRTGSAPATILRHKTRFRDNGCRFQRLSTPFFDTLCTVRVGRAQSGASAACQASYFLARQAHPPSLQPSSPLTLFLSGSTALPEMASIQIQPWSMEGSSGRGRPPERGRNMPHSVSYKWDPPQISTQALNFPVPASEKSLLVLSSMQSGLL